MDVKLFVLLGALGSLVVADTKYEFSQRGKECITKIGSNEETIRKAVPEMEPIDENNELAQKFLLCSVGSYITDDNTLSINDDLRDYMVVIFTTRIEGRRNLAKLLVKDCLEHCKDVKGDSKGKTAVKAFNCIKTRFQDTLRKE